VNDTERKMAVQIVAAAMEAVAHYSNQGNDNDFWITMDRLEQTIRAEPEASRMLDQVIARRAPAPARANYAWIIDKDNFGEQGTSRVGWYGPKIPLPPEALLERLKAGEGEEFRLYQDGDTDPTYEGRFLMLDDEFDNGDDPYFAPLDEFGRPDAGCTSIWYYSELTKQWGQL
jgi:hypothetical protein